MPCDGCVRCCLNDAVRLMYYERGKYKSAPHPYMAGERMVAHKLDGSCYYLGEKGCTIQDDKPEQCRVMDCRVVYLAVSNTEARKNGIMPVWERGRELVKADPEWRDEETD